MSLAALAPGLSEAELRTALYLASIQDPATHIARASSREIAATTRIARSNAMRAIDSLTRRSLIATHQGGGARSAAYLLNFTQTAAISSGPAVGPLHQPRQASLALQQGHPSEPPAPLDIDTSSISCQDPIIDRVLAARPQHWQKSEIADVKGWAYKWLTLQRGQQHAPIPDDTLCAQIATAAGGAGRAGDWIRVHMQDHQAETAAYLLSAMMQQIHGIPPATIRRRRDQLRIVRRGGAAPPEAPKIHPGPPGWTLPDPDPEPGPDYELTQALIAEALGKVHNL